MKKIYDQILYSKKHFCASFPAIVHLSNGQSLVFFRLSRDASYLLDPNNAALDEIHNSIDHLDPRSQIVYLQLDQNQKVVGSEKITGLNIEAADQDPSVIALSDQSILLGSFSWYPLNPKWADALIGEKKRPHIAHKRFLFWGSFYQKSFDMGQSWTARQSMPPLKDSPDIVLKKKPCAGGPLRGAMLEDDGIVYAASYSQFCYNSKKSHQANLFVSKDLGNTFEQRSVIASDEEISFYEPSLYMSPSKTLFAFMRTSTGKLATAKSRDFGENFEPFELLQVEGEPFHVLKLSDCRVFLSYGARKAPFGVRARILDAECTNIEKSEEFIIRHDAYCADVGYPWACQLDDGSIYCVYYFCTKENKSRHIAASLLRI